MSSKNGISVYLNEEDKSLFDKAVSLHGTGKSKLAKDIIHSWLFNNKLYLISKK